MEGGERGTAPARHYTRHAAAGHRFIEGRADLRVGVRVLVMRWDRVWERRPHGSSRAVAEVGRGSCDTLETTHRTRLLLIRGYFIQPYAWCGNGC